MQEKIKKQRDNTSKKIASILRVTRKSLDLNQEQLASELELQQSALSRIEGGTQCLSTPQWFKFCDLTGVPPDSVRTGYVDLHRKAETDSNTREGSFRIPKKFTDHRGSTVRAMLPFLIYTESSLGSKKYKEYLKSLKFDPDFFLNLSNKVNINFCIHISKMLIEKGLITKDNLDVLTKSIGEPQFHGFLHNRYNDLCKPIDLINSLIFNAKYYECNFQYAVKDKGESFLDISITPEEHLQSFFYKNDDLLGDFLCQHKQNYFKNFANSSINGGRVKITEKECHYKGFKASRCLYQIQVKQ